MTEIVASPEQQAIAVCWPSVNALAAPRVRALVEDARMLRLGVERTATGACLVDAGVAHRGGIEAGRRIAEICMGGLGVVTVTPDSPFPRWPWQVSVRAADPVLACLASQYAGWSLSHGEGKGAYHAMASGPARAAAGREELFKELGYEDRALEPCLVLETDSPPPVELIAKVAARCQVEEASLTLILTPTRSLAGATQIVARVLEVGLHKAHALGFALHKIVDGAGAAPLCPPAADFLTAMGRTNDAILFGGQVHLFVDCAPDEAEQLAHALPSSTSSAYGKPFARIFKDVNYDFYQIDPHLFAPAVAIVTEIKTGKTFRAGAPNGDLLDQSF